MSQIKIAEENSSNAEKLNIVCKLVHRTDPGIGGFYDNMGSWGSWRRLKNHDMYNQDPAFLDIPLSSFLMQPPHDEDDKNCVPLAWQWNVYTLYQKPLVITYGELDPNANYRIRTTYGRYHTVNISLFAGANKEYKIHEPLLVDKSFCTTENKIPKEAYANANGTLILNFIVKDGERGPNVSEIFIIKE